MGPTTELPATENLQSVTHCYNLFLGVQASSHKIRKAVMFV